MYTVHWLFYTVNKEGHSVHFIVYTLHCVVYIIQCGGNTANCMAYTVHYTLYKQESLVYSVQS